MERLNRKPITPGHFGYKIDRLRTIPPAVELTNLPAVRPVECRRQIQLTLPNDRLQELSGSERDKVRMRLAARQLTFDRLARFDRIALWVVLRRDNRTMI
jgi:hypothetical protein